MLDRDFLLTLAAMLAERAQKHRPGPRQLVCLIEVLAPRQGPIFEHGAAIAPHGGIVGGDQLCGHHAVQRADDGAQVFVFDGSTPRVLPQRLHGLIGDQVIPAVGLRAADTLQYARPIFPVADDKGLRLGCSGLLLFRHGLLLGCGMKRSQ